MNVEEFFGANAGKVWEALSGSDAMNIFELSKKSKLKTTDVLAGLGWLAREGKISIEEKNKTHYYHLIG